MHYFDYKILIHKCFFVNIMKKIVFEYNTGFEDHYENLTIKSMIMAKTLK